MKKMLVESSHKLFELNLRNISLLWGTETQSLHSCIVGAGDGGLEDRSEAWAWVPSLDYPGR